MFKNTLVALVSLLILINPVRSVAASNERYYAHDFGFSVVFPAGWEVKKPLFDDVYIIEARHNGERRGTANIFVGMGVEQAAIKMSPMEFYKSAGTGKLLDSGETSINGVNAIWIKTYAKSLGLFKNYTITYLIRKQSYYYIVQGIITGGAEPWCVESEDKIISSIRSFRFEEPVPVQ